MKNRSKAFRGVVYTMLGAIILFATVRVVLAATALDFTLHNHTEKAIHQIHISGHDDNDWGDDVLGKGTLEEGESTEIKFSEGKAAPTYDMRVEFEDKTVGIWPDLDLTQITDITIFYKDGKPWAKKENK